MAKEVLENQPHFPRTLSFDDIDREVFNWVDKSIEIVLNGKKFSTYKLYSNQRMTEYGQTWKNLDDKGNIDINFKTITRESNPQVGEIHGGDLNIPGFITFPIFREKTIDENGVECVNMYSMRQPTQVNMTYTIGVFTNSYKVLNTMNAIVHREFNSIDRYIFPNGFAIPMTLSSIADESDYTIDDRKYYSQTFQIKVKGYIIAEEDYIVSKVPTRGRLLFASGMNSGSGRNEKIDNSFGLNAETMDELMNIPTRKSDIEIEELCDGQKCWEGTDDEIDVGRKIVVTSYIDYCEPYIEFQSEYRMGIESIELKNVSSYRVFVDGVEVIVENSDVEVLKGDAVRIEAVVRNPKELGEVTIVFYDLDSIE